VRLRQDLRVAETGEGKEAQRLVQVWPIDRERALSGLTMIEHALTGTAGGRIRMKRPTNAASRAGLKLEEAIAWIGVGPEKGDLCVDLGAAPGGWSQVAVRRGATVIAVDPAEVKAELPRQWFTQVKLNAFEFAPSETMDWLLCDMAWRPLEVAQLVSKWGRRVWARQFIANFKLPMKKKVEILRKITSALEAAGWRGLRARQLYFDRDEVTIYGWLDPKIVVTGIKPPFQLRSRQGRDKKTREPALTRAKKRPRTKRKRTTKTRQ
jgi:23S rRNA (cytidine2498-2'-O)-methyltransferase